MNRRFATFLYLLMMAIAMPQYNCAQGDARSEESDQKAEASADSSKSEEKKKSKPDERVPVEVSLLEEGEISAFILLSTNLETEKMADVYPRVQGIIEQIRFQEGDFVRKGTSLAKIEDDEYALAARKAEVNSQKQKNVFDRSKAMHERQLLSNEEFEAAKFTFEAAEIEHKQAKLNLDYTSISSPISGVVGERLVRVGDRVQPSDKLFSVINTEEMIAVVYVPEKEIGRIRKGQQAFVRSDHLEKKEFPATVKRVSPVVDPQSGTFKVTLAVRNRNNTDLRPGMFVNAHIITETRKNAILVPKTAIVFENEKMNVFVVQDSIAQKIEIEPGFENYAFVESRAQLKAGDKIIMVGQSGLKDQAKVKITATR